MDCLRATCIPMTVLTKYHKLSIKTTEVHSLTVLENQSKVGFYGQNLPHLHLCLWLHMALFLCVQSSSNRTLWQSWISCKCPITRSFVFSSARLNKVILTGVSSGMRMRVSLGAPFLVYHRLFRLLGEGNGNPLQYACLENPMDGGAW